MEQAKVPRELALLAREACEAQPHEVEGALERVLAGLCGLLGATNAYWIGAIRDRDAARSDPMVGWRAREVFHLHDRERNLRDSREVVARFHAGQVDPSTVAHVRRAGGTRAHLRPELVPDPEWEASWLPHEFLRPRGVHDQLVGACSVAPGHESYLGLVRGRGDRKFGARDRDQLLAFLELSTAFHRRLLVFRGLAGERPLTERERDVLRLLVTDASEKEIGRELGIGARTVHQHALAVYEKLGVRGRLGLLSRLLSGAPRSPE